ncbi:YihY/virulence factor BrkB family protein [Alloiococcus sp. CFN-8]|uniref:YihY/virulence factor BrkB family protein n=1 Tax=Alloiococcus sp. CFN-8 TaxID=3416081 RepID=UPI003CF8A4B4
MEVAKKKKGLKGFANLIIRLVNRVKEDDLFGIASQLAYSLLVALFPFIIFLMTVIGNSNLDEEVVLNYLSRVIPGEAFNLVENTVVEVLNHENIGLLSFALIFAIWSASKGIDAIIKALNKAYNEEEKRGLITRYAVSIFSTIIFAFAILLVLVTFVLGNVIKNALMKYLPEPEVIATLWQVLRYTLGIGMIVLTFAVLYRFAPSRRLKWKEVFPGALIAAIGWIVTSVVFSFYVNNFANYTRFYGSIGAIIILLTWLYLSSFIILLGGEVNAMLVKTGHR